MPRNGSGAFARVHDWTADADAGIDIRADRMDEDSDDLAQGISDSIARNGETTTTAEIPFAQGIAVTGVSKGGKLWQTSRNAYYSAAGATPSGSTSQIMLGLGSSWKLTPSFSGRVRIKATGWTSNNTSQTVTGLRLRYGTGSAPSNGDLTHPGTLAAPEVRNSTPVAFSSSGQSFNIEAVASGLSQSTEHWFDIEMSSGLGGTSTATIATLEVEEF